MRTFAVYVQKYKFSMILGQKGSLGSKSLLMSLFLKSHCFIVIFYNASFGWNVNIIKYCNILMMYCGVYVVCLWFYLVTKILELAIYSSLISFLFLNFVKKGTLLTFFTLLPLICVFMPWFYRLFFCNFIYIHFILFYTIQTPFDGFLGVVELILPIHYYLNGIYLQYYDQIL